MQLKTALIISSCLFALNLFVIYLVSVFTMELLPGKGISGNGNPGIVLWYIEIPIYISLIALIIYIINKVKFFANRTIFYPILLLCALLLVSFLEYRFAASLYHSIHDRIKEFGAVNQYTNTMFINYYTFTIGILLALIIQSIVQKLRRIH
ncbi:hypothetical protein [Paenibacillus sp. NPDC058071]|uniref:hypothetical protein n=1 Tax=Paenibacillus sp. NPDC058071 TaxID=3346326 RepID=UPI0036D99E26